MHWGRVDRSMLAPDGRSVFVAGSNEGGQLGLPPSDGWVEGAELRLPEPAATLAHAVVGGVVRTRSGAVYGWGAARPGPEHAPGLVDLPGPATLITGGLSGPCAFIPAHGGRPNRAPYSDRFSTTRAD